MSTMVEMPITRKVITDHSALLGPGWTLRFDHLHVQLGALNDSEGTYKVLKFPDYECKSDELCSKVRNQLGKDCKHSTTRFRTPKNLRILLGNACNFRCSYCGQKHDPLKHISKGKLLEFLSILDRTISYEKLQLVQFWGGEPLLYWDAIKFLIKEFDKRLVWEYAGYSIVTNGLLMDDEKVKYISKMNNFGFILSHDGPGQYLRGKDVLDPVECPRSSKAILELAHICNETAAERAKVSMGRNFGVNPVITTDTKSLADVVYWYDDKFGWEVPIAECIPVVPIIEGTEQYTPGKDKFAEYESMLVDTFKKVPLERFDSYTLMEDLFRIKLNMEDFVVPPHKAACFVTDPWMLSVDLQGRISPCQTYATVDSMPDGTSASMGYLQDQTEYQSDVRELKIKLPTLYNWTSYPSTCSRCAVLSMCMGGCPFLRGEAHVCDCRTKFHHYNGLMRVFLSRLLHMPVDGIE